MDSATQSFAIATALDRDTLAAGLGDALLNRRFGEAGDDLLDVWLERNPVLNVALAFDRRLRSARQGAANLERQAQLLAGARGCGGKRCSPVGLCRHLLPGGDGARAHAAGHYAPRRYRDPVVIADQA